MRAQVPSGNAKAPEALLFELPVMSFIVNKAWTGWALHLAETRLHVELSEIEKCFNLTRGLVIVVALI